jgi:hypothetical protein
MPAAGDKAKGALPSRTIAIPGTTPNVAGPRERLFADPHPGEDETSFQVDNTSAAYYETPYYKAHQEDLQQIPAPRLTPPRMDLADVIGTDQVKPRLEAKRIVFHAVGDTGASNATHIATAAHVADTMTAQLADAQGADKPAFFFHLGDVIYNFGETQYYYDQFYEPYRAYDAPIFAIPGNHDGFPEQGQASLFGFLRNFCTVLAERSPDSGGLVRSTMNQPGVYFTLNAPFVSIIGLYSNVLEGPGVISSEGGAYPIGDQQLAFLVGELEALKQARENLERAVVLAVHHPVLAIDPKHGGSRGLMLDIDKACEQAGLWPDLLLCGHAHLYQRFNRTIAGAEIPYVVAGCGGHNVGSSKTPTPPQLPEGFTMPVGPRPEYGYLMITVDMGGQAPTLTSTFSPTSAKSKGPDTVKIDLKARKLV